MFNGGNAFPNQVSVVEADNGQIASPVLNHNSHDVMASFGGYVPVWHAKLFDWRYPTDHERPQLAELTAELLTQILSRESNYVFWDARQDERIGPPNLGIPLWKFIEVNQ
jgi:hypothetical protein